MHAAIGAVLSQVQESTEHVITYWNRKLPKAERNYSTTESEALAVVASLKEFYPYVYSFPCKLITEHNPLKSLKGIKDVGGRLTRWLLFLQHIITTHPKFINNINMNKGFETFINID